MDRTHRWPDQGSETLPTVPGPIGGQSGVNFSEKFTKFAWFTLCKLFGNFLINVVNLLTKM